MSRSSRIYAPKIGDSTRQSRTIQKLNDILANGSIELTEAQTQMVAKRLGDIKKAMDIAPKSLAWKVRSKVGTKVRWYLEVEEVQR